MSGTFTQLPGAAAPPTGPVAFFLTATTLVVAATNVPTVTF